MRSVALLLLSLGRCAALTGPACLRYECYVAAPRMVYVPAVHMSADRPLLRLRDQTSWEEVTRDQTSSGAAKSSNYDAIRESIAASRKRSVEQGRQGCCAKASSYLDSTVRAPADSRWARAEAERPTSPEGDISGRHAHGD